MAEKLSLKREETLKVYFMLGRPGNLRINVPGEFGLYTLAFNEQDSQLEAQRYLAANKMTNVGIQPLGTGEISELLGKVEERTKEYVTESTELLKEVEPPKPTKEQFVNNLKLFKDDFITEPKDKAAFTRIIKKYGGNTK